LFSLFLAIFCKNGVFGFTKVMRSLYKVRNFFFPEIGQQRYQKIRIFDADFKNINLPL
jgi:hypothetical protein